MLSKYLSHITSSLYSCILLWKGKLPFPLKNTPKRHRTGKGQGGLTTLVRSEEKTPPRAVHRCETVPTAESKPPRTPLSSLWSPSSPAPETAMVGDVIGTESGYCMITDIEEVKAEPEPPKARGRDRGKSRRKREFPPPLTLLRETGKMPWTLKREYSGDGRLIITAEKVRRRECIMEARREDGRVTMSFLHEDGDCCEECGYPTNDEEEEGFEFNEGFECVDEEEEECGFEIQEEFAKEDSNSDESERRGDLRQCATYDPAGPGFGDPNSYLGRPASTPLRPMTPVM
ncbi:The fantastic four family [Spatholobus suberectus]|nr:The fantastic four family [Spatholobus suberectus]